MKKVELNWTYLIPAIKCAGYFFKSLSQRRGANSNYRRMCLDSSHQKLAHTVLKECLGPTWWAAQSKEGAHSSLCVLSIWCIVETTWICFARQDVTDLNLLCFSPKIVRLPALLCALIAAEGVKKFLLSLLGRNHDPPCYQGCLDRAFRSTIVCL